jgi:regulator of sirC expression with transglutaminase-like and TPR domain
MNAVDLPFLIRLIDDPSPRVRDKIAAKLRELPDLRGEILRQGLQLSLEQDAAIRQLVEPRPDEASRLVAYDEDTQSFSIPLSGREAPREPIFIDESHGRPQWLHWLEIEDPWDRLEAALDALAHWIDYEQRSAFDLPPSLSQLLDGLNEEYSLSGRPYSAVELSEWLFVERGMRGATSSEYYLPVNSHMGQVITLRRGIPISLVAVFMLLGRRLGLEIYGCNFPGHFLAWTRDLDGDRFFDCFDRGRVLSPLETAAIRKAAPDATSQPSRPEDIVARFLRNLAAAYQHQGDRTKAHFMLQLLGELESSRGR